MVTVTSIPVATASNTVNQLLVELREPLCQAMSASSMIQPQTSVTFTPGIATTRAITVDGTTTYSSILPILVTGSIVYQQKGTCRAVTKLFNETFSVAFTELTTAPTNFTITEGIQTKYPSNIKCCNRAYEYDINTAITITAA